MVARICVVLIGVLRLLPILLCVIFIWYCAMRPGQTRSVSDFPTLHFLFKYLSTDDALNYPKPFLIRSQRCAAVKYRHLIHLTWVSEFFAQFYSNPKCVRICFLSLAGFVSFWVNIVETFIYRSFSIRSILRFGIRTLPQIFLTSCTSVHYCVGQLHLSSGIGFLLLPIRCMRKKNIIVFHLLPVFFLISTVNFRYNKIAQFPLSSLLGNQEFRFSSTSNS